MEYHIKVITNSSKSEVVKQEGNCLIVKLHSIPAEGKANAELLKVLAKHFGVAKSRIEIVKGLTAKTKVIEIE